MASQVTRQAPPASGRTERPGALVVRPGWFLTLVIVSCLAAGLVIFLLLKAMRF